ncbi:MAG: hypothetical protein KBS89_02220, partial [Bacteroidales bacterium]|nr:hypothetical protein [Candidatus Egerieousia equi]
TQGYVHVSVKESPEYIKTINKDITRIKAIKIPNSFTNRNCWVKAENGEELVGGFCWKNTPFNNESSSYDETYFSGVRSTVCPGDVLAKAFDAANKYCGAGYRMPTSAEFQELIDNTINEFVTDYNGKSVNGILFTSRKDSNMSVFFPATGCGGDNSLLSPGFLACYWSCSLFSGNPEESYYLNEFLYSPCYLLDGGRFNGTSVRPVKDVSATN